MIQPKRAWILLICGLMFTGRPASCQQASRALLEGMLDCTMHEDHGPWVPVELRRDGLLRFSYVYERPKKNPGEYDYHDNRYQLYVAFWNPDRTKGEFLDFSLDRTGPWRWLTISNQGDIFYTGGKLDLDFFQGGFWTRTHYMMRLKKLRASPVETVSVRDIKRTVTLCDSLRHGHPEWRTQPPKRK